MIQNSFDNNPALYLIPTPIGNLDDITIRAINVLKDVDYLLCEDTRVTSNLLKHFDIEKKLVSCHEFNEDKIKEKILNDIKGGKNIGLVTDQGSPMISDPGYKVVKCLKENKVKVIALPGPTAFVPALMDSGINSNRFVFYGFLNNKKGKRKKELEGLKREKFTLIFYEAVHRVKDTLNDIYDVFGDRKVCLCRELSKLHEEIITMSLSEIINLDITLKGEFVIIVEGDNSITDFSGLSIFEHVQLYLNDGVSKNEAIKMVARDRNVRKSDIYKDYHTNK